MESGGTTCRICGAARTGGSEPDPCLGWIDGAVGACCGHGHMPPYVFLEGQPRKRLSGDAALDFFLARGVGPNTS